MRMRGLYARPMQNQSPASPHAGFAVIGMTKNVLIEKSASFFAIAQLFALTGSDSMRS